MLETYEKHFRDACEAERRNDVRAWKRSMRAWLYYRPSVRGFMGQFVFPDRIEVSCSFYLTLANVAESYRNTIGPDFKEDTAGLTFMRIDVWPVQDAELPFAQECVESHACA